MWLGSGQLDQTCVGGQHKVTALQLTAGGIYQAKYQEPQLEYVNAAENALKDWDDINTVDTDGQGTQLSKALWQMCVGLFILRKEYGENTSKLEYVQHHQQIHKIFNMKQLKHVKGS
ncbi:hypothetical protein BDD12DRAFT_877410 [Trichophaea hybrida]|nr:hypothetical protein BDD12DRAFT_877410 [Trichophaea hybrida]